MSEQPTPSLDVVDRERRLDEAVLAIEEAAERGDWVGVPRVLAGNFDLRDELNAYLVRQARFLGFTRPSAGMIRMLAGCSPLTDYTLDPVPLAQGSFGAVYRARDRTLERTVAIKVLRAERASNSAVVARFLEEAQLAGQLVHPAIAPLHEVGWLPDGRLALVMKLVDGRTLARLLSERPAPDHDRPRFLDVFLQMCRGVGHAHSRGVIHRDLKPANVMVGAFGEVQVMDWGLAKVIGRADARGLMSDEGERARTLRSDDPEAATQAGVRLGTLVYMPPEQFRGEVTTLDERADVFALGAILCEILTGQPPFAADGPDRNQREQEVMRQLEKPDLGPALARLDRCGADAELIALACSCLAVDRKCRPASAGVVAGALTAYLAGVQERLRREQIRLATFRWRAVVATGLALVLVVGATLGMLYWVREEKRQAEADFREREAALKKQLREEETGKGLATARDQLEKNRPEEARLALAGVQGRMAEDATAADRARAEDLARDLTFVDQREKLRQESGFLVDGTEFNASVITAGYDQAFRARGIDLRNPATAAEQIRQSPIRAHLLAALDHWALLENPWVRGPILETARRASETSWGQQFRENRVRDDPRALARLVGTVPVEQLGAVEAESLGRALMRSGGDAEPFLRAARRFHRKDFWINALLAEAIAAGARRLSSREERRRKFDEAVGYARVAQSRRPEAPYGLVLLGQALLEAERLEEAEDTLESAISRDARMPVGHLLLARCRLAQGRLQEAENACRDGLRLSTSAALQEELGRILGRKAGR